MEIPASELHRRSYGSLTFPLYCSHGDLSHYLRWTGNDISTIVVTVSVLSLFK